MHIWGVPNSDFFLQLCVSRKYPDPHHGRNWKFQRGRGLIGLGNSCGVGGLKTKIHFQRARTMIVSHRLLSKSFWCFCWSCCVFPYILRLKTTFLFHKSFWQANELPRKMRTYDSS